MSQGIECHRQCFNDVEVAKVVAGQIDGRVDDLFDDTVAGITTLVVGRYHEAHTTSLEGLQRLPHLRSLSVVDGAVTDVSPLAGLTDLADLDVRGNYVSDLSPSGNLTNLGTLTLSGNRIVDLSPLSGLHALEFLNLEYNLIASVKPLEELTVLDGFSPAMNRVPDLGGLQILQERKPGLNIIASANASHGIVKPDVKVANPHEQFSLDVPTTIRAESNDLDSPYVHIDLGGIYPTGGVVSPDGAKATWPSSQPGPHGFTFLPDDDSYCRGYCTGVVYQIYLHSTR
ncbi:leucine-rich repeat domain-containing protein [Bifidobacterium aemilianum]|uniref:leucine-rich repeat domain-containing protein n=1 Tax=Bifidobacterium aemilianum TaxID=2493120 RepID=UPI000DEA3232|nr:leucine-rich repeat domain-containing protein [Bifidobacterium aemilianum]